MNGFRTALIICGVFIMAFVLLWSTHQQRHQHRRSVIGRFGSDPDMDRSPDDARTGPELKPLSDSKTDLKSAPAAELTADPQMRMTADSTIESMNETKPQDRTDHLNVGLTAEHGDGTPDASTSRRFSVSEPGTAEPVRLGSADGVSDLDGSRSPDDGTGRRSFGSRLRGSRLAGMSGMSTKRFGRFGSRDTTAATDTVADEKANAEITAVGPLGPRKASTSRFQRGLETGKRFIPSNPRRAARRADPTLRSDDETPRLTISADEPHSMDSPSISRPDALTIDGPSPVTSPQPAVAIDSPSRLSVPKNMSTTKSKNETSARSAKSSAGDRRWWQGRLPQFKKKSAQAQKPVKHTSTAAMSTVAPEVLEVTNEHGVQNPSQVSGVNEANREEREMFKRTTDRTDKRVPANRKKDTPASRQANEKPLRARQTSPASLWGDSSTASQDGKPESNRRSRANVSGARRHAARESSKDGGADSKLLPGRADKKSERRSTFGSRYSRARRRSESKTQAVRDTSLPSRSQPRTGQDTGVFAGLMERLSSAVGKSDNRNNRPSRRHPLEKHDALEHREPMLTVSGFDQISEDKMILPGNNLGELDTGHGLSERDNEQNIDRLQVGSARGANPSRLSPDGTAQTRQELKRELDSAEYVASEPLKPQFDLSKIDTSRQIDQIAQIVELSRPVSRDEVMSIYRSNEDLIAKPVRIIGLSAIDRSWVDLEQEPETGVYSEIVLTVQLYDARGPIDESDLHRFSDIVLQTADHIGGRPHFAMSFEDALEHSTSLELFCKDYDRLAILSIVVGESSPIGGEPLREFADSRGLVLNSVKIYHWPNSDPEGSPWRFGIANLFEPGTFDDNPDSGFETRGLRLFMSIPTVREPEKVFDDMVTVAQDLCVRFSATIVDQNKNPMTDQGIADIRRQMVAVSEEMRGHGFAPGDENTIRIFPEFGQH